MIPAIGSFVVGLLIGGFVTGLSVWLAAKSASLEVEGRHRDDLERVGTLHRWQMESVRRGTFGDAIGESTAVVVKPKVSLQR